MIYLAHLLIVAAYAAAPVLAVASAVRRRRRDPRPGRRVARAAVGGLGVGLLVCFAHAIVQAYSQAGIEAAVGHAGRPVGSLPPMALVAWAAGHARPQVGQVLLTAYWATAFILVLGVLDRGLWDLTQRLFHLRPGSSPGRGLGWRIGGALAVRAVLVGGVIIPYVLAATLTYRPRVSPGLDPVQLYKWAYEPVRFPATDGSRVAGWWIPAADARSDRTLLLCPGPTGGMPAMLPLARGLRDDGFNLLVFDFRGHGDSGGQLVSYGDLERRDVLGAVRWVHQAHPGQSRQVVGLGVSTGGAALLSAAADPSPDGQAIDALAVYAPFDRLDTLLTATALPLVPPPAEWVIRNVGLPLAGLQVGSHLSAFAPADAAANLWPRPLMVLHGMNDELIPFAAGQAVYRAASEPKQNLFIIGCRHSDLLDSDAAREAVRKYFGSARPMI